MIFKHILFPIDFSSQTRAVQNDVEWLARKFGSRVTLLHAAQLSNGWCDVSGTAGFSGKILNPPDYGALDLNDYPIDVPEDRVTRIMAKRSTARDIADCASKDEIDLVVMGASGYGTVRRLLLGSIQEELLREVSCPVWTRSTHDSARPLAVANILCALEVSQEAYPLLQFTKQIADAFGASVWLLHSDADATPGDSPRCENLIVSDEILSLQRQAGTDFSVLLTTGSVPEAVSDAALDHEADLVLIGRGVGHHWFDSHGYEIIRHSPCPVLSYSLRQKSDASPQPRPELAKAASEV